VNENCEAKLETPKPASGMVFAIVALCTSAFADAVCFGHTYVATLARRYSTFLKQWSRLIGVQWHATYISMWTSVAGLAAEASGQYRAMLHGINGKYGILGNATSATCRPGRAIIGSNPTLTAI
jgi:hypothetical protein